LPTGPTARSQARVNLYLIGDSFSEPERIGPRDFPANYFLRTKWENQNRVQLDTTTRNVLIIETVERHFRDHFSQPVTSLVVVPDTTQKPDPPTLTPGQRLRAIADLIQPSAVVEERLETLLFGHPWALWWKEQKAGFNLAVFDRANPKVGLSRDREHVFVGLDTDTTTGKTSSFTPLPDVELDQYIDSLNAVYDRYRASGFDAVYLSIIPNKVTLIAPDLGSYNHLIERIQQHPRLRMPVIDVYSIYRKTSQPIYAIGDSHWNCTGRAIWLQAINERLATDN
ncbi:MAG: hypothetical protein H7Z72_01175, partial [Bacteroidetes bacterium]|nr:hypothetical protein [Fibrella sp.]